MKLVEEGYINIIKKFESLEQGWDGYNAKPIQKEILVRFRDMSNLHNWIKMFQSVGIQEIDISVIPTPNGTIQLEGERDEVYLEIELQEIHKIKIKPIDDNNSDFDLVYIDNKWNLPHCKKHGAMNKVSDFGIWRCLRSDASYGKSGLSKQEVQQLRKGKDCRAGCIQKNV